MTLYGTYASSLQQGDIASSTAANPGQALPPYRSTQTEVGYKVALARIDVSTAVFRLDRPFANTDPADNVFKISGEQINYGVEATISGRLTDRLITSSGLTAARHERHQDRQPGDRRPALRRHSGVSLEPAGRIPSAAWPRRRS